MSRKYFGIPVFLLLSVLLLALPASTATLDVIADLVLGQPDFTHNTSDIGASAVNSAGFKNPISVAIDRSVRPNRIYVADRDNNRVLGWPSTGALYNGATSDRVFGQPDFSSKLCNPAAANTLCSPMGMAVDSHGNLYVTDRGNSRVLIYFTPYNVTLVPGSGDTLADVVIGQPDMNSSGCSNPSSTSASASSLCSPYGVAADSADNVYVADMANNRVVGYSTPMTTDAIADLVIGQPNFTSKNSGAGATGLNQPNDVAIDAAGNVYVADFQNNRVIEYNSPMTTDSVGDRVFGQPTLTSNTRNNGGISANSLYNPTGVATDDSGNVYIADRSNRRVLEYNTPLTTDTTADRVFGQGPVGNEFTGLYCNKGGVSATSLCFPTDVAVDSLQTLYVVDFGNNRVLVYDTPVPDATIPAAPTNLVNTPGDGSVTLSWTPSVSFDVSEQRLYRGLTPGGPYGTLVQTFSNSTTNNYVDMGLTNETPYYYVIRAVDSSANVSANSNEDISTPMDTTPPAAPTNLTNTSANGSVTLNWTLSTSPDAVKQKLYRSLTTGGPYTLLTTFNDNTTQTYVDSGLTNGTPYYYVITAVDGSNNESGYSNEDLSTPNVAATTSIANVHFEELPASTGFSDYGEDKCPLQYIVEFTFETTPGGPGVDGRDTNEVHPPSVVATMTFPDGYVTTADYGRGKKETHENPHALGYVKEFEVRFDCHVMVAHVGLGENVTVDISGTFNGDGHPFSGSAVLPTHD